jgi:aminomethyltransferase
MGILIISGPGSTAFLNMVTVSNIPALVPGQAKYSLFLNEHAGIIDDLIIYRRENDYLLIVNAGNKEKDIQWLQQHKPDNVTIENISDSVCLLALQGPASEKIFQSMVKEDLSKLRYFTFMTGTLQPLSSKFTFIARTGYTGEDGFEIIISKETAPALWNAFVAAGVKPCGLGCRDTLRLEACMLLHGHEITDNITPLDAELDRVVYWEKDFIGKTALLIQKNNGKSSFFVAFTLASGIPRAHCSIVVNDTTVGEVTSGTYSPTFKKGIGVGYSSLPLKEGDSVALQIHGQLKPGIIVKKPFYKRKK